MLVSHYIQSTAIDLSIHRCLEDVFLYSQCELDAVTPQEANAVGLFHLDRAHTRLC